MSSIFEAGNLTSGNLMVSDVEKFVADLRAASNAALGPASRLLDGSRARTVGIALRSDFLAVVALSKEALGERTRVEADHSTKPEVLREQWRVFGVDLTERANSLDALIKTRADEYTTALELEAIPVSADPSAALLARGEIEAALQVDSSIRVFVQLAARGGDVAAAVASPWGRSIFEVATGDTVGFDQVQAEAIRTALSSEDAGRRRAAEALHATMSPRPGLGRVQSLYEAIVLSVTILSDARKLVRRGVVIT